MTRALLFGLLCSIMVSSTVWAEPQPEGNPYAQAVDQMASEQQSIYDEMAREEAEMLRKHPQQRRWVQNETNTAVAHNDDNLKYKGFLERQGSTLISSVVSALVILLLVLIYRFFRFRQWKKLSDIKLSRPMKSLLVLTSLWLISVEMWGQIFDWENHFMLYEYFFLHIAIPVLLIFSWCGFNWVKK